MQTTSLGSNVQTSSIKPRLAWLIPALLVILTLVAVAAAVWQWQRSQFHSALSQTALKQLLTPIDLNQSLSNTPANAADFLRVQGQWLPDSTVYISPRMQGGRMGAWAVSMLRYLDSSGAQYYIPVDRGWAAQNAPNALPNLAALTQQSITLQGHLLAKLPSAYALSNVKPTAMGLWANYDAQQHAELLRLDPAKVKPFVLQLSPDSPDAEAATMHRTSAAQTQAHWAEKSDKNRGYALQWLGLACVGLFGLAWMWRKRSST